MPNRVRLLCCPDCRLAWWRWPPFDPAALYDRAYFQSTDVGHGYDDYATLEAGLRRTARARLRRLVRLTSPGSSRRLLDIGCGTGVFLDEARGCGWRVRGIEVSEYAAAQASRQGIPVFCARVDTVPLASASFDCVTLWDVIEHMSDPLDVLRRAARALRPGGILALSTGDFTSLCARLSGPYWHLFSLPEHLFFFSLTSLRIMLRQCGFQTRYLAYEINWVPINYIMERLFKLVGQSARVGRPGIGRLVVPATLFDVLGIYAIRCPARGSE
ncbi:MAG: class I SAM-dependent methyltransferase [Planctomycetota bacterium]